MSGFGCVITSLINEKPSWQKLPYFNGIMVLRSCSAGLSVNCSNSSVLKLRHYKLDWQFCCKFYNKCYAWTHKTFPENQFSSFLLFMNLKLGSTHESGDDTFPMVEIMAFLMEWRVQVWIGLSKSGLWVLQRLWIHRTRYVYLLEIGCYHKHFRHQSLNAFGWPVSWYETNWKV